MKGLSRRVEWYVSWIMDDFFSRCFRTLLQSLQNRLPIDKAAMATGWDEQREINSQFIQFSQLEYEKMYMMATNAMQISILWFLSFKCSILRFLLLSSTSWSYANRKTERAFILRSKLSRVNFSSSLRSKVFTFLSLLLFFHRMKWDDWRGRKWN